MHLFSRWISSPLKAGLLLASLSLFIFFVVYTFFYQRNYFHASLISNAFVMPLLYAIFAVMVAYSQSKKHKELKLLQSFGSPFATLCLGGVLSLLVVFLFFNYLNPQAQELLKKGIISNWFERNKIEMIQAHGVRAYEQRVEKIKKGCIFNIWIFLVCSIFCFFYYFMLSLLIGLFFRRSFR